MILTYTLSTTHLTVKSDVPLDTATLALCAAHPRVLSRMAGRSLVKFRASIKKSGPADGSWVDQHGTLELEEEVA